MSYYTIAPHHIYGHRASSPPVHHSPPPFGPRHPIPSHHGPAPHSHHGPPPHHHHGLPPHQRHGPPPHSPHCEPAHPHHGLPPRSPHGPPPHPHHAPPPHPYHDPPREYDLDEEERLALAHLRYIQQKRQAQQAALEREAAVLRAKEERDNAIRRAVAEKRIAEAAAALKKQREREIQEAVQRERERVRSAILEQRQRQDDRARQQYQAQLQAAQHQRQLQVDQARSAQVAQAKQCAAKVAQRAAQHVAKEVKKEYKDEYEVLNNLLGSLFGISLEEENEAVKADIKSTLIPTPAPAPAARAPTPPAPAPAAESTPFPEDINDLLSQYLGLRIEPTPEAKPTPTSQSSPKPTTTNTTPAGLNDFLSRYGLVFEPLDVDEEVKALNTPKVPTPVEVAPTPVADPPEPTLLPLASSSTPAPAHTQQAGEDHPITNYFNNMVDLPPFLRDMLGHAEVAYNQQRDGKKEEVIEGKGKGVAERERNPTVTASTPARVAESTPTPVVESAPAPAPVEATPDSTPEEDETAKALSTLSTISSDLDLVRDSFDFPPTLAFAPSSETSNPPALLFNKVNSGYHAQTHKLLQLLLAADAINSNGNKDVRKKRKEIVREVEMEIERLEKKRDEMWEQVKAAREAGEHGQVHDKEEVSSCASSAVDPAEVKEEVETEHVEDVEGESSAAPSESKVPATSEPTEPAVVEESDKVEEDKKARVDESEGYEVL